MYNVYVIICIFFCVYVYCMYVLYCFCIDLYAIVCVFCFPFERNYFNIDLLYIMCYYWFNFIAVHIFLSWCVYRIFYSFSSAPFPLCGAFLLPFMAQATEISSPWQRPTLLASHYTIQDVRKDCRRKRVTERGGAICLKATIARRPDRRGSSFRLPSLQLFAFSPQKTVFR